MSNFTVSTAEFSTCTAVEPDTTGCTSSVTVTLVTAPKFPAKSRGARKMACPRETEGIVLPEVTVLPPRRMESAVGEEETV
jgi:hypothetical protein